MTLWLKRALLMVLFAVLSTACAAWFDKKPFAERQEMEQFAQKRYLAAVDYMRQSRFELARQQFSIASASSSSADLRDKALTGYLKADKIIEDRR